MNLIKLQKMKKIFFLFLFVLIINLSFNFYFYSKTHIFSSDSVSDFLLYEEVGRGKIFLPEYNKILKHIYYILLIKLFGLNFKTILIINLLNLFVLALVYIFFYFYYLNKVGVKNVFDPLFLIPLFLVFNNDSLLFYKSVLADPLSRNIEIGVFFLIYFFINNEKDKPRIYNVFIFLIMILWFFSDGLWLATFALPYIIYEAYISIVNKKSFLSYISSILQIILAAMFSILLKYFLNTTQYFHFTENRFGFASLEQMKNNLNIFIQYIFLVFDPFHLQRLSFIPITFIKIFNILLLSSIFGFFIYLSKKSKHVYNLFFFLVIICNAVVFIISDKVIALGSSRYLIIFPFLIYLFLGYIISHQLIIKKATIYRLIKIAFIFVLVSELYLGYLNIYILKKFTYQQAYKTNYILINLLKNEGLTYGYSDYWNSAINTFLSNKEVKIRQIICNSANRKIQAWFFLSSTRWYSSSFYEGKTFLLISDKPESKPFFNGCELSDYVKQFGKPQKIIHLYIPPYNYSIMIWPYNIEKNLI